MICNMDCFNCPFPDCINDGKETKSERTMKKVDKEKKKDSYYQRNREKCIAKVKEYRSAHSERVKEYQKEYYRRNAEEKKLYAKKHHQELSKNPEYVEKKWKKSELYYAKKREERRLKELTDYDKERNAIHIINPAIQYLDKDLLAHALTIIIDKYCSDRNMSCQQKCDFVFGIYKDFVELKNNV